jgi:DNA-binding GntR family transcriptional regulator
MNSEGSSRRAPAAAPSALPEPPPVLNEAVYDAIKQRIFAGQLRPGQKLTHQDLAEALGVSRTPVRESLERLYQEGFVRRQPNRGYFVSEIDAEEARELYETREALEVYELRRAFERGISGHDLEHLQRLNEIYGERIGIAFTRQRLLLDRDFHIALAALSGNRYMLRCVETVFERLILKRRSDGYSDTGEAPYREHLDLLAALRRDDLAAAQHSLATHIANARARLLTFIEPDTDAVARYSPRR